MRYSSALAQGAHTISVDGVAQAYHVAGFGPVCVVHPGGPGGDWRYMRMPLLEDRLTMVYLEPIGTGGSGRLPEHPAGYSIDRYSRQLHGFLSALDLTDIFLLGHSHGGFVAQRYALDHPDRIAGLILYATSAVTGPAFIEAADLALRQTVAGYSEPEHSAAVLRAWQTVPAICDDLRYTETMRGLLPVYFADPGRDVKVMEALREALRFSFVQGDNAPFDVRAELPLLTVPTLILAGAHDFICGLHWAAILNDAISRSLLLSFGKSGHFIHIEQAGDFAEAVVRFSTRKSGSPAVLETL